MVKLYIQHNVMALTCGLFSVYFRHYLPRGGVPAEVAERVLEPVVDLVQRQLLLRRLDDGLEYEDI